MSVDCAECDEAVDAGLAVWINEDRRWNNAAAGGTPYCSFECRVAAAD